MKILPEMRDVSLKEKRDSDIYRLYLRGLEATEFTSLSGAAKYVCRHPAPCFYITAKQANLQIGKILSNISLIALSSKTRAKIWRLYDNYVQYMKDHPDCREPRQSVLDILVEQEAPEFYLDTQRVRKILKKEVNKRRRKWMDM